MFFSIEIQWPVFGTGLRCEFHACRDCESRSAMSSKAEIMQYSKNRPRVANGQKQSFIGSQKLLFLSCGRGLFGHVLKHFDPLLYQRRELGAPVGIVAAQPVANAAATDIGIQQAFATRKVLRVIAVRQLPNIRALKCRDLCRSFCLARTTPRRPDSG